MSAAEAAQLVQARAPGSNGAPDHAAGPADELGGLAAEAAATVEERELASFEQIDEFRTLLADFLAATAPPGSEPGAKEGEVRSAVKRGVLAQPPNPYQNPLIAKLLAILSPYQEQPYLLDPYLDELVVAPVQALQRIIRGSTDVGPVSLDSLYAPQLQELAVLIYSYTKIRGDKVITRFFPHEVDDLLPVVVSLELLSSADASESTPSTLKPVGKGPSAAAAPTAAVWELRYVLLLWLSLVCMIPFDLRQLDQVAQEQDGSVLSVAGRIEKLGRRFLASPGKERDAAAMMMGKLFQRRDLKDEALARFLEWSQQSARADEASSFLQTGIMQALCEIIKVSDPGSIETHLPALLDLFDSSESASGGSDAASQNVLVLRYEAKMACRLGLKLLKPRKTRRTKTAKSLDANLKTTATGLTDQTASAADAVADEDEDEDIPEQVDQFVSKLLTCLESKDTTVRYSAAKGIARLCERLPPSFVSQLTDAIRSLFAINVIERDAAGGGGEPDLSNASEHTWQGACMAIAELARRGLLVPEELDETMRWILRALTFDVRRGANSVGSAVRDAACYVLWALARAHTNAEALRSHAQSMAAQLLVVATLDREVSIRRAASAAFQECVGRMGNIPHGIDVLRKTDFYAVGVRRNAFVSCAPEVAAHDVYRPPLLHHLLTVTISHWDRSMRTLAAESIRALVDIDFERQAEYVALKLAESVKRHDAFTVHGSLLALSQLAELCEKHVGSAVASNVLRTCLDALHRAPLSVLRSTGAAWPLYAACELIRTTSTTCLTVNQASISVPTDTLVKWNDVLDQALARQEEYVHEALVTAHGALSRVQDPTTRGWKSLHPTRQQSNALLLGFTNFTNRSGLFEETIRFLLSLLDSKDRLHSTVIEVRRNTVRSIDQAIRGLRQELPSTLSPETSEKTLETLLACLEDYTIDQRGDVGSWVRIASLTSLRHFTEEHVRHVSEPELSRRITKEQFDRILAGVLKQCVERIDAVREHAGAQLVAIRACSLPLPKMEGADLLAAALPEGEEVKFQDAGWAFPRIINLLEVPVYRVPILRGIATSIASKSDMAQRIVGTSLVDWANAQPDRFGVLLRELHGLAVANFGANSTFVPVVSTMTLLIEGGAADELDGAQGDELTRKLGRLCTQNVDKIKSMARVQASAALCVNLLRISTARSRSLDALPLFLLHSFTAIRTSTAEQLYIVLQDIVEDEIPEEAEEILLNTKWAHRVQNVQTAKLQEVLRANLLLE